MTPTDPSRDVVVRVGDALWQRLLVVMGALAVGGLVSMVVRELGGTQLPLGVEPAVRFLDLDSERSLGTWVATISLVLVAALSLLVARVDPALRRLWQGVAVALGLASMEEITGFHETVGGFLKATYRVSEFLWVVPGGIIGAVVVLLGWQVVRRLPEHVARPLGLGILTYLTGVLVFEALGGAAASLYGRSVVYGLLVVVEETMELLGVVLVLRALVVRLGDLSASHWLAVESGRRSAEGPSW